MFYVVKNPILIDIYFHAGTLDKEQIEPFET